jgi:hypothetical protein
VLIVLYDDTGRGVVTVRGPDPDADAAAAGR